MFRKNLNSILRKVLNPILDSLHTVRDRTGSPGGGGDIPANAMTIDGEAMTIDGEAMTVS